MFQLLYADHIPISLIDFLNNPNLTFVGVGIEGDVEKLLEDHELNVMNTLDLRFLAATRLSMPELRNSGLKELTKEGLMSKRNYEPEPSSRPLVTCIETEYHNSDDLTSCSLSFYDASQLKFHWVERYDKLLVGSVMCLVGILKLIFNDHDRHDHGNSVGEHLHGKIIGL
ncbi:hypothetical protein NE237_013332 [Protea cynaroides]|uniref:Uncharacterized protein n=1 Tax=Protea cynaroides TaxID=273540 RepID=A0A9Q0GZN5_9MAGN|nr:hypothetical protein NE237_013332 [Protea cynaroides]